MDEIHGLFSFMTPNFAAYGVFYKQVMSDDRESEKWAVDSKGIFHLLCQRLDGKRHK